MGAPIAFALDPLVVSVLAPAMGVGVMISLHIFPQETIGSYQLRPSTGKLAEELVFIFGVQFGDSPQLIIINKGPFLII